MWLIALANWWAASIFFRPALIKSHNEAELMRSILCSVAFSVISSYMELNNIYGWSVQFCLLLLKYQWLFLNLSFSPSSSSHSSRPPWFSWFQTVSGPSSVGVQWWRVQLKCTEHHYSSDSRWMLLTAYVHILKAECLTSAVAECKGGILCI